MQDPNAITTIFKSPKRCLNGWVYQACRHEKRAKVSGISLGGIQVISVVCLEKSVPTLNVVGGQLR